MKKGRLLLLAGAAGLAYYTFKKQQQTASHQPSDWTELHQDYQKLQHQWANLLEKGQEVQKPLSQLHYKLRVYQADATPRLTLLKEYLDKEKDS